MAILIKDEEADRLIRELVERTGETITDAVKKSVAARLQSTPLSAREIAERTRRLKALLVKADAMQTHDNRSAEEIIGFNERGHFD
jgi:antitoxin VapB